jgi:tetratricopeptide (TPR) repeat protein
VALSSDDTIFWRAVSLESSGDFAAALAEFRRAIDVAPSDPRYWVAFGHCLMHLHHWTEAVDALSRGIDLKPHYGEADARLYLAEALVNAGDTKRARLELEHIAAMVPSYPSYDLPIKEARERLGKLP